MTYKGFDSCKIDRIFLFGIPIAIVCEKNDHKV